MNDLSPAEFAPSAIFPVVETPDVAVSGILCAMLKLTPGVTKEQQKSLLDQLSQQFSIDLAEARSLALLGNWLASQSSSPVMALQDLTEALLTLPGAAAKKAYDALGPMADAIFDTRASETTVPVRDLVSPVQ